MTQTELDRQEYLRKILTARVYDVARETPLDEAKRLSLRIGNKVLLKREDTQPVFSFKLRGAFNKMVHLSAEERARGVICASAGNHAQGVALAARRLGCRAVIVMPVTAPALKVEAVRNLGGEVVLVGESFSDAAAHAVKMQVEEGLTFVHPFDDPYVIAGQGTIGMEILRDRSQKIEVEARKKATVQIALATLSYSEIEAAVNILSELNGTEGLLVASKIADRVGITRSVIVNALRKFESAGVIESKSLGMKGTYIRVLNDYLLEEIQKLKR